VLATAKLQNYKRVLTVFWFCSFALLYTGACAAKPAGPRHPSRPASPARARTLPTAIAGRWGDQPGLPAQRACPGPWACCNGPYGTRMQFISMSVVRPQLSPASRSIVELNISTVN